MAKQNNKCRTRTSPNKTHDALTQVLECLRPARGGIDEHDASLSQSPLTRGTPQSELPVVLVAGSHCLMYVSKCNAKGARGVNVTEKMS